MARIQLYHKTVRGQQSIHFYHEGHQPSDLITQCHGDLPIFSGEGSTIYPASQIPAFSLYLSVPGVHKPSNAECLCHRGTPTVFPPLPLRRLGPQGESCKPECGVLTKKFPPDHNTSGEDQYMHDTAVLFPGPHGKQSASPRPS